MARQVHMLELQLWFGAMSLLKPQVCCVASLSFAYVENLVANLVSFHLWTSFFGPSLEQCIS